jgi:N-methylhydantoinase A
MAKYFCSIDTGGTFTDCVVMDDQGRVTIGKSLSTPDDFARGFFNALEVAAERLGLTLRNLVTDTSLLFHGTTVGTNAIIQMQGSRTGLITTRGHGDALLVMRAVGRSAGLPISQLLRISRHQKPQPIVPRARIREVSERVDWKGSVVLELNQTEANAAINELIADGVEAIAISFLWSFVNPAHELRVKQLVREKAPQIFVTCGHELISRMGEYERTAAVAINCFIGAKSAQYIGRLETRVRELGYNFPLLIMQCSGGVTPATDAIQRPLFTIDSGPAGGVMGAKFLADTLGHRNAIASDVGGTSFDVGLIYEGVPLTTAEATYNQYTFYSPRIEVLSIGSGGGSIIWIDELSGTMRVGPQSAGADPGPACYGRGGTRPTITDAAVIVGYLNPENFLAGRVKLDARKSAEAMRPVAEALRLDLIEAASGALEIGELQMAGLMHQMTLQRGLDPRDFVVYAYGGGGPMHCVAYARELGCGQIVVPLGTIASAWSALGILASDVLHVREKAVVMPDPYDAVAINQIFAELEAASSAQLRKEGIPEADILFRRHADMQFRMQIHRVEMPLADGFDVAAAHDLPSRFADTYERLYGRGSSYKEAGTQIGALRSTAIGRIRRPSLRRHQPSAAGEARPDYRDVYWRSLGKFTRTPTYSAAALVNQNRLDGPAIIELPETTIVLPPGCSGEPDDYGNFLITIEDPSPAQRG